MSRKRTGRRVGPEDYRVFHFGPEQWGRTAVEFLCLDVAVSYLFYHSFLLCVLALPLFGLYQKYRKAEWLQLRREEMRREFLDAMKVLLTQLQTGYSPENAFREAAVELGKTYEPDSFIRIEFDRIAAQLSYHVPLERLLSDLGNRCGVQDIHRFTDVFVIARRSGGDLIGIVRNTIRSMEQKLQLQNDIEAELAGKRMEQRMMSLIPMLILAYVGLTSPGFLDPMYEGLLGRCIMTVCLGVYGGAVLWGQSIMRESSRDLLEE
ncbi:MAG: type II secretion system F family protein [Lachnospiraceae bacterium]|nr:type II secretion system F family protein [Lachnospiraceae bacterium]